MPNRTPQDEVRDLAVQTRERARTIVVTTDETFITAGEMLKEIKTIKDRIDAIFDPIVTAAHKAHKVALDQKKEVTKFYVEADKYLRDQVNEYNRLREERTRQAALALARSGEMSLPQEAAKVDGIGFVHKWCFEVIDPDAVPREYTVPDEVKIRKIVNAMGESANIPGVRVWSYKTASVR